MKAKKVYTVEMTEDYENRVKGMRFTASHYLASSLISMGVAKLVQDKVGMTPSQPEKVAIAKPVKSEKTTTKIRKKQ